MTKVRTTDGYIYKLLKFTVETEELLETLTLDSYSIRLLSHFRDNNIDEEFSNSDSIDLQYSGDLKYVYEIHRSKG
jgi:hypothetical protein